MTRFYMSFLSWDWHPDYTNPENQPLIKRFKKWMSDANIPMLVAAGARWQRDEMEFTPVKFKHGGPMVLDSGGYNILDAYDDYPFSIEQYHAYAQRQWPEWDWVAQMDYPTTDSWDDRWSKQRRMEMTVENAKKHQDLDPEYHVLPVLQGGELDRYLEHYDMMEDAGVDTSYMGIGDLVAEKSPKRIKRMVDAIQEYVPDSKFHGFGLKVSSLKQGLEMESMDSHSWSYAAVRRFEKYEYTNGDGPPLRRSEPDNPVERYLGCFDAYYRYMCDLDGREPPEAFNFDGR